MDFKKLLVVTAAALILSACGEGDGSPIGSGFGDGFNSGSSGDKSGAYTGGGTSSFDYFNKACEGSAISQDLSITKCLNAEFVGTSQNTGKACTVKYAFKDGTPQTISQIVHIDDLNITLDSSKAPDKFKSYYQKAYANGLYLMLSSDYAITGTDISTNTANTKITTGQFAETEPSNIEVVLGGGKRYRCNLTGFSSAN